MWKLKSLFAGGSHELVGLDISSSAVKLLELSRRGDQYQVESYSVEPLPPNAVNDKQINDPRVVGECIARCVSRAGTRTRHAALAVSGASVITKVIQLPTDMSEYDLEEQIKAEADQHLPYRLDEVNFDFQVLEQNKPGSNTRDVLLAACRKEQVETRCAALEIAGLVPKVVDVEAYALENACRFLKHQIANEGREQTVAVVDMGANSTSVLVLHDMEPTYTRDQAFGGKQLTEDIMRHYAMTFEEAGKAKRFGGLPDNYRSEVLDHFVADMAQQIDRSLQFFFASSSRYSSIDQIILAGGCAHIPGVDQAMMERLQIPTVLARPFSNMTVSPRVKAQALARDESALLIACGLAYRAFDQEG